MRMGPAERLDVVVNFAGQLGQNIYLVDTLTGTQLLEFRVTQHVTDDSSIPATLRPLPDIGEPSVTRNWSFDHTAGHWTINGLRFDPSRVDARPVLAPPKNGCSQIPRDSHTRCISMTFRSNA